MEKLSTEILREIISNVHSSSDLQNLRLVQHSFAELTNEFFFRVINIRPSPQVLSSVLSLSRRKDLAKHVRELAIHTYNWGRFAWTRYYEPDAWTQYYEDSESGVWTQYSKSHSCTFLEALEEEGWGRLRFDKFLEEDREFFKLQKSPDYITMLSEIFSGFPKLNSIRMEHDHWKNNIIWEDPESIASDYLIGLHGFNGEVDDMDTFNAIVNAAYITDSTFTSFTGSLSAKVFNNPELLRRAGVVFRNCRVLALCVVGRKQDEFVMNGMLFNALSPAVHLEELRLDGLVENKLNPPLTNYLGENHIWPHLRVLAVGNMDNDKLIEVLARHKKTLREVVFSPLRKRLWTGVMGFMKRELSLTRLAFGRVPLGDRRYYYGLNECRVMEDYVISDGELPGGCIWG